MPDGLARRWLMALLFLGLSSGTAAAQVRSGTGFFITPDGTILTSAHVVKDCREIAVFPPLGGRVVASLRVSSASLDIALLTLPDVGVRYVVPNGIREPAIGTPVRTVAYGVKRDAPEQPIRLAGTVIGRDDARPPLLVIDVQVEQGTSGAPMLDATDALAGVVIGRYTDTPEKGVMVSAAAVRSFLATHGIRLPPPREPELPQVSQSEILRNTTLLVQCVPRR
jgi:S1-C subfamily serine protease